MAPQLPQLINISQNVAPDMVEDSFPYTRLPFELQLEIQKYDIYPRDLSLRILPKNDPYGRTAQKPLSVRQYRVPVWLHVNRMSRIEALKSLKKIFVNQSMLGCATVVKLPIYFNPSIDTIHFRTANDLGLIRSLKPTLQLEDLSVALNFSITPDNVVLVNLRMMPKVRDISIIGRAYNSDEEREKAKKELDEALEEWEENCLERLGYVRTGGKDCLGDDGASRHRVAYEKTDGPWYCHWWSEF